MDGEDYLGRYRSVSNKLKKKFMRKPNVAEVAEQYGLLARKLHDQESFPYAAFFKLAQARCEHTQNNAEGEANALIQAARNFLRAHQSLTSLNCMCFTENLEAAFNCYNHAIRVTAENQDMPVAAMLCLELANALKTLNRSSEAIEHYQRAAEYYGTESSEYVNVLKLLASAYIDTRQYDEALETLTEALEELWGEQENSEGATARYLPWGVTCDQLRECETTLVLLLMVLQPTPQHIDPKHATILERYMWNATIDQVTLSYLEEDFFLLLQSLVLACQSRDAASLLQLQKDLFFLLSAQQNELVFTIIQTIEKTELPLT